MQIPAQEDHRDLPLYIQIASAIRKEILSGRLEAHQKLPSEKEMMEMYQVARATVRQALAKLTQEGLIHSRRAVGYFVAPPSVDQDLDRLFGFSEFMAYQGVQPSSKLLVAEIRKVSSVDSPLLSALQLKVGDPVIFLRRLRMGNREPLVIAGTYLPEKLFPGFLDHDIEKRSVYDIMDTEYGLKPVEAVQTFEGVTLDELEANIFGLQKGAAGLYIERVGYAGGRPVEYAIDYYRGDRTKFRVHLSDQRRRRELKVVIRQSFGGGKDQRNKANDAPSDAASEAR
ncbi:MAG TPA: GntR family transcriptional regulator [Acidobacteriota bacterium]|nr:GntR family transcriptional regulator [Acidobacteriota bacterium]